MFIIQEILISDDIIEEQFLCNLSACKGACCWEGDFGAPLEDGEIDLLEKDYEAIRPFLSDKGIAMIKQKGKYTWFEESKENGTPLIEGGACAYMTYNELGIAQCGIEQAHKAGATSFLKPISCHLYPIRVNKEEALGFEALNYDRWDICKAACSLGKKEKLPVYRFVQNAIIRKYGQDFYDELHAAAAYLNDPNNEG